MPIKDDARRLFDDPAGFLAATGMSPYHLPRDYLAELHLTGLQLRFAELRDRIAALKAMADEQRVSSFKTLDDVVPLLFQHTMYKSYPLALLEKNRFDQLTKWLSRLSAEDLSGVSISDCDCIDSWVAAFDEQSDLRITCSSGSAGKMSFLPRTASEYHTTGKVLRVQFAYFTDPDQKKDHRGEYYHIIWPSYSGGYTAFGRVPGCILPVLTGSPDKFHPLYPGRMSADMMFLAARLQAAAARGDTDSIELSPYLKSRRAEFDEAQKDRATATARFFDEVIVKLRGERVIMGGTWAQQYAFAHEGLERGLSGLFAADSIIQSGGGPKGQTLPADWEKQVARFTGVERLQLNYGMSEILTTVAELCPHGRYHVSPLAVIWVLDPDDGRILPREGVQTGRAAFFDVTARTMWGGFITGDEVTIDYKPCSCGRSTVHLAPVIQRFSEKRGGDDKISCAASDDAHQTALDFLNRGLA